MIGGDFNILRGPWEKNNDNYNNRWPFLFNAIIDAFNLREIDLSGRKYTWANNLINQTFEKLDRVLVCTDLEGKFPHTTVYALNREISDHTPLLVNTGDLSSTYQPQFKFELGWLLREGFMDMVTDIWHNTLVEGTAL
jgi:endonuclease/exonuclease/phosphatase family metal-dependent hydrolase